MPSPSPSPTPAPSAKRKRRRFTKRRALELSIAKWELLAEGLAGGPTNGLPDCALCENYNVNWYGEDGCVACPVFAVTGSRNCGGTPYDDWRIEPVGSPAEKRAAQAEIRFLKSLLAKLDEPTHD